jgi:hypothetical protein
MVLRFELRDLSHSAAPVLIFEIGSQYVFLLRLASHLHLLCSCDYHAWLTLF